GAEKSRRREPERRRRAAQTAEAPSHRPTKEQGSDRPGAAAPSHTGSRLAQRASPHPPSLEGAPGRQGEAEKAVRRRVEPTPRESHPPRSEEHTSELQSRENIVC